MKREQQALEQMREWSIMGQREAFKKHKVSKGLIFAHSARKALIKGAIKKTDNALSIRGKKIKAVRH